jgi:hypothetical protein
MACTEKPIARRSRGSESPTTAKSVGLAMLFQAIINTTPISTIGQLCATAMMP